MKLIPLATNPKNRKDCKNKGKYFAQVDDEDYDYLMQWRWGVDVFPHTCYAVRREYIKLSPKCRETKKIKMHRQILGLTNPDIKTDHIDRDGLNNQRNNLRIATKSQNNANRRSHKNSTSKYIGVHKTAKNKWIASITKMRTHLYLGIFIKEEDAAKCYNKFADKLHGQFANLNIV